MKTIDFDIKEIKQKWPAISKVLKVYKTKKEYRTAVKILDFLIDEIGEDEEHPLTNFIETLGVLVEDYERKHYIEPLNSPIENFRYLIKEHSLKQSDFPEIGSQGVVSEILNGKRELNRRQILALSKRFNVSPMLFMGRIDEDVEAA